MLPSGRMPGWHPSRDGDPVTSACCLQVQYTALPHYEDKFEDFKADTVVLRRRFTPEGERHKDVWGAAGSCGSALVLCIWVGM